MANTCFTDCLKVLHWPAALGGDSGDCYDRAAHAPAVIVLQVWVFLSMHDSSFLLHSKQCNTVYELILENKANSMAAPQIIQLWDMGKVMA